MLSKQMLIKAQEGIDKSEIYLALVTKNFLEDDFTLYQWNYAKRKMKPFALFVKDGIKITEDMLKDVNVVYECHWTEDNFDKKAKEFADKYLTIRRFEGLK